MDIESTVNAEPVAVVEQPVVEQQSNSDDHSVKSVEVVVAEPQHNDKQVQSQEENAKFAQVRRDAEAKAEARARDNVISELFGESHGIKTYSEYQKAIERQEREEKLQNIGIDYDEYEQMVSGDPRIREAQEILTKQQEQQKISEEANEFLEYFRQTFGRNYDVEKDQISYEVGQLTEKGIPLKVAYKAVEETNMYKRELEQLKTKLAAEETNKKNADSSVGPIGNNNVSDSEYVAKEVFETNRSNQEWVKKNLDKIIKSRPKW